MNLILQIQSSYNQFTKAEKKVADYCLAHRDEIPYLSMPMPVRSVTPAYTVFAEP